MRGLDDLKRLLEKYTHSRPVLVYGDPDADGLISLLLVCQFLDMIGVKYSYFLNDKRKHGFTIQPSTLKGFFVIAVDFHIPNSIMQSLVDNNVAILNIDHHDIKGEYLHVESNEAEGIVINNQYYFEDALNTYQSGAGVVYEALSEVYPEFKSKEREALVGITLLSDARPIENDRARKYLKTTYSADPTVGYISYLISSVLDSDFGFGVPCMDRNFIDYTFSPRLNSLLRFSKETEALNFILGRGLDCTDTKKNQSSLVDAMKRRASFLYMDALTVIAVDVNAFPDYPNVDIASFIGLVCSNVKGTGISTLGFVYDINGTVTRASFRGRYDDVHYLTGFQSLGIKADGHPPAFGMWDLEPTTDMWNELNELVGQLDEGHTSQVRIINSTNLTFTMTQMGMSLATENCYVRDMYRSYIKYTGKNAKITRETYKTEAFSQEDYATGREPDLKSGKEYFKYILDEFNQPITKYIEYFVDGRKLKSFGVRLEDGLILPILEKGHIQLYVREMID